MKAKRKEKSRKVPVIISILLVLILGFYLRREHSLELFMAVRAGDVEWAQSLLKYPWTDVNYRQVPFLDYSDYMGTGIIAYEPIDWALYRGQSGEDLIKPNFEMFKFLITKGAHIDQNLIEFLISWHEPRYFKYLIEEHEVDLTKYRRLLEKAQRSTEITELLFANGVSFETDRPYNYSTEEYTDSLLIDNRCLVSFDLYQIYVAQGAKLPQDFKGASALESVKDPKMISVIVAHGVSVNEKNKSGRPIFFEIRDTLLLNEYERFGADFNAVDNKGNNVLAHVHRWKVNFPLIRYFLRRGINPKKLNNEGLSAYEIHRKRFEDTKNVDPEDRFDQKVTLKLFDQAIAGKSLEDSAIFEITNDRKMLISQEFDGPWRWNGVILKSEGGRYDTLITDSLGMVIWHDPPKLDSITCPWILTVSPGPLYHRELVGDLQAKDSSKILVGPKKGNHLYEPPPLTRYTIGRVGVYEFRFKRGWDGIWD